MFYSSDLEPFNDLNLESKCIQYIRKNIQSPPKECIHYTYVKGKYSKPSGTRGKVGGPPNQPLSCSKLDQASFWNSKRWRHNKKNLRQPFLGTIAKSYSIMVFVGTRPFLWILKWGPVWTNGMECVTHPLLSICPPLVLSIRLVKMYTFFFELDRP